MQDMAESLGFVWFCATAILVGFVGSNLSYSWQKKGKEGIQRNGDPSLPMLWSEGLYPNSPYQN